MGYYITGDCHGKFDKIVWFNRYNHELTENYGFKTLVACISDGRIVDLLDIQKKRH